MSEPQSPVEKKPSNTAMRLGIVLLALAGVIYLLYANIENAGAILMVLFGFGGVIMIHEFGHFIVGKLTDMKVTAFSIGFSPVLFGIRRMAAGWHVRILPTLVPKEGGEPEQGALDFTFGKPGKEWETEYRIGLIPFGGFVALVGQEDVGVAEQTNDPRSFLNKPLLARMAVIMAGVTFNAVSALIIFMIIFHNGIQLQAPVVGDVIMNSPADKAGLRPGDEIVAIEGDTFIDYMNVALAGALGDPNEPINMEIRRREPDGDTIFPVSMIPKSSKGASGVMKLVRVFGVSQAPCLEIAKLEKKDSRVELLRTTGLMEKDVVVAINGKPVKDGIEFDSVTQNLFTKDVSLTIERTDPCSKAASRQETKLPLTLTMVTHDFEAGERMDSVAGMVPALRVFELPEEPRTRWEKFKAWVRAIIHGKKERLLEKGDVFVKVGDCDYPTISQLRSVLTDYTNAAIAHAKDESKPFNDRVKVVVRRVNNGQPVLVTLDIKPELASEPNLPSMFGFVPGIDADSPVISTVIETPKGLTAESIPAGATIVRAGGANVSSFYDIVAVIRANAGKEVAVEWQKGDASGSVSFSVSAEPMECITARSMFANKYGVPLDNLRWPYHANSYGQAVVWGWKRTELFITQAVVTLVKLISGALSPQTLSGPVGIVNATYKIASGGEYSYYFYWLGLISASIAVMNLLPLPILDGGLIVIMLIEKIKGSPINHRVQSAINYAGLALLAALMLYVTFNDIKSFFM